MKIINKQILCEAGDFANEDVAGINEYGAWLLDGATGLSGAKLTGEKSDARWYTKWWDLYLSNNLKNDIPLCEIITNGILQVKIDFHKAVNGKPCSKLDYPSSSIAVLKWHDNGIEYFSLGDSPILIQKKDSMEEITDKKVSVLDQKVYDAINQTILEHNISAWEAKSFVLPMIRNHRMLLNTEKGYWILGFDIRAVNKASQGILEISEPMKILMASDGFSALVDKYHVIEKENFILQVEEKGIPLLYENLRNIENLDKEGIKYPRFKKSDDASAVYFEIEM
ncbi:hypothetical protein J2Z76_000266 [Sedimentibacter acidaminivorans]|uniref:Uncharacterized protein n=1 Tax=Sedimentibacter acidaminivorans TaxID=913099 RepID=A0ABS4G9P3_9FIRM|nr:protein phosphatase 2C domain-containing protein [Sedimentibacter acidaminivorans]MBP1924413.1 hypothetical protein [Sedimentibacter acidaminivorans]